MAPRAIYALTLLVLPASAVRKAELDLSEHGLFEDDVAEDTSTQRVVKSALVQQLPGNDQQDCCCREGPCSWSSEQKSFAEERQVNKSTFDKNAEGSTLACCQNVTKQSFFWRTVSNNCGGGGVKPDKAVCNWQEPVKSSIEACSAKLSWWFKREDWYTLLADCCSGPAQTNYKVYVPCLNSKRSHVDDVVIHKLSFFNSGGWANPIRTWVISRPECSALSERDLKQAIEVSYDDMCTFPLLSSGYHPNFQPERACTYNKTADTIHLSQDTFCPEGHRCACPVLSKDVQAVNRNTWVQQAGKGKIRKFLDTMLLGGGVVAAVSTVATVGTLAAAGAALVGSLGTLGGVGTTLAGFKWAISTSAVGTGMLVYGSGFAVQYLSYGDCQSKVGCYAMPCVEEEDGCRIALGSDDESDPRNPYWFMPPPMHKCAANVWGNCKLSVCTAQDARSQLVGEIGATYGLIRKKTKSSLYNCQPTLANDMPHTQIRAFERKVTGLRAHEHMVARRTRIRNRNILRYCAHKVPTSFIASAQCNDGTYCDVKEVPGPNCCLSHKGMKQCPAKFPVLCNDNFCDTQVNNCMGSRGGPKGCMAENECKFLLATLEDDKVLCGSTTAKVDETTGERSYPGELVPVSSFGANQTWCAPSSENNYTGLLRCPWNAPVMCANRDCNGEHCCRTSCEEHGGAKRCENLQVEALQAGAARGGPLLALAAAVAALLLR